MPSISLEFTVEIRNDLFFNLSLFRAHRSHFFYSRSAHTCNQYTDSVCLICYISTGHLAVYSLPSLRQLMDVDFLPLADLRYFCLIFIFALSMCTRFLYNRKESICFFIFFSVFLFFKISDVLFLVPFHFLFKFALLLFVFFLDLKLNEPILTNINICFVFEHQKISYIFFLSLLFLLFFIKCSFFSCIFVRSFFLHHILFHSHSVYVFLFLSLFFILPSSFLSLSFTLGCSVPILLLSYFLICSAT